MDKSSCSANLILGIVIGNIIWGSGPKFMEDGENGLSFSIEIGEAAQGKSVGRHPPVESIGSKSLSLEVSRAGDFDSAS